MDVGGGFHAAPKAIYTFRGNRMKKFITVVLAVILLTSMPSVINTSALDEYEIQWEENYQHNLEIYNKQPTDDATLEIYKMPGDYIESKSKEIIRRVLKL